MQRIPIKNINQGGIADSDYMGPENSVAELVGLDIHSEPGLIKLNQALSAVDTSAAAIDQLITAIVPASTGDTYFFGAAGKIWKRTSAGVWSLVRTASPAAGAAGILSAQEYQGYIYYAMQSRLGRFDLASTWNDSYATFTNTDDTYHPMQEVNQVLYIGDKFFIAQVDAGTFSANALDIKTGLRISALGTMGTDLLIGTMVASNVVQAEILRWNTWSVSYSVSDPIPEVGINCFLDIDNAVMVSAGTKGNLYYYNGTQLELYKTIKGTWSATNKAIVNVNAKLNFHGKPLFGLSLQTGTGVSLGVYSFARTNRSYPYVLALEYPLSTGHLTNVVIGALAGYGDTFYVSWKDTTTGTVYGLDQLNLAAKYASGYFTTRVSLFDRSFKSTYGAVHVPYRSLPTSTAIKIHKKVNHGTLTEVTNKVTDTERLLVRTDEHIGEAVALQVRVELTGSVNTGPEVEMALIDVT